jgi:hypothetical protein
MERILCRGSEEEYLAELQALPKFGVGAWQIRALESRSLVIRERESRFIPLPMFS